MKKCSKCEILKDLEKFPKDKSNKDGLGYRCKDCEKIRRNEYKRKYPEKYEESQRKHKEKNYISIRASQRRHYLKNKEKLNERRKELRKTPKYKKKEREYRLTPKFREYARRAQKKLRQENKELVSAWRLASENRHKIKRMANAKFLRAVKKGKIVRPMQCELCHILCKPDGHHEDYNKPLEVKWLCKICHSKAHGKLLDL